MEASFWEKSFAFVLILFALPSVVLAQSTGGLRGRILDPNGAVIPGAKVTLSSGPHAVMTPSNEEGIYVFKALPAGSYTLAVTSPGFQPYSKVNIAVAANQVRRLDIPLAIAAQHQTVTVQNESGVGMNPDQNANALVIQGPALDALSSNPSEFQNELEALAGPGAGPNGTQIFIDGFPGGRIPPKSSIREISINQDPFSAEFARPGYGKIEIFTKSGLKKFSGQVYAWGIDSAWNTAVPLAGQRPAYYIYFIDGNIRGPITDKISYSLESFRYLSQGQSIIDAIDPSNTSATIHETFPNPSSSVGVLPHLDFQLGGNNTMSISDAFYRYASTGDGPGQLNLPEQAFRMNSVQNTIQVTDTAIVNPHLILKTLFQYQRLRASQIPSSFTPTVTVQGAFTTGGSNSGVMQDHEDIFSFGPHVIVTTKSHTLLFGTDLRTYRDANYSTAGSNGEYLFDSIDQYLAKQPAQYQVTLIQDPLARAVLFDGALYFQDDWYWKPGLTISDGLRFETQNRINDHADWGPRFGISWAPGQHGKKDTKTVLRAGYGWFYDRFTVPNASSSIIAAPNIAAPYIMKAIHQNGINQQSYVIHDPDFYNPNTTAPPVDINIASDSIPSIYSVDPHFHAALDMQAEAGIDRQIGKNSTLNVSYRYTRGIHQYLTNNVTAPNFDPATYMVTGPPPPIYNYQFQSGGVYKEHQIVVTANIQMHRLSLHGTYTFSEAKSDTQGADYIPSVAQDPGLDYGRASFGIRDRIVLFGTYTAPYNITIAPFFIAQSGTPYNLTIGSDLTENNQFNARPTYGVCGAADVVSTRYGCLDASPVGKGERIVPYGLGVGPANFVMHLRIMKTFGIGPRTKDGKPASKYKLTLEADAANLFNIVNLGTPNGTLNSPLFGTAQSLASGMFANPAPGNRSISAYVSFDF